MKPRIVLTNGCWDPPHYGHLLHLRAARKLGDVLVVSVTRDKYVNKGPGRPVFREDDRADMVRAFAIVDEVRLVNDSLEALQLIRPQVFVKGMDYKGRIRPMDEQYCKENGIEIVFTDERTWSSTALLRHYEEKGGQR